MIRIALLAFALSGCVSYAGITAAPNGVIWIATNNSGSFGPTSEGVYACVQRSGELSCSKVTTRGLP